MTTLKILPKLIPVLLGAALLFVQPAVAGHGHHSGGESAMRMLKGLDLTDAQREKIRTLVAASKAEKPATVAMQQQHQALQALVSADQFDEAAARLLLEKQQSSMLENRLERLKLQHSIRALLTDEQKTKLDARMAKMRERMVERVGKEN